MAQALEKVNVSQNLEKCLLHKKWLYFSKIQFLTKSSFLKSLTNRKKQPLTLSRQVLVQHTPIIFCCYYKPLRATRSGAKRRYRKKTIILKEGARGDRGSPDQNESQYQTFPPRNSSVLRHA